MQHSHPTRPSRFRFSFLLTVLPAAIAALAAAPAGGTTITVPAAASIQGISPFFSDVRVFNTSYDGPVTITATYRCFLGNCPGTPPELTIDLAARDSQAFNDIVAGAFASPDSAGGIEFTFDGDPDLIIVTSRLYSTAPTPTVGMFIPGLDESQAHQLSALTSVRSGGDNGGFRTNVGVYNPERHAGQRDLHGLREPRARRRGGPEDGAAALGRAGQRDLRRGRRRRRRDTDNGVILVQSDVAVFSYAAVIDNNTSDPYLVLGSPDRSQAPSPTGTPEHAPTKTGTPTPSRTPRFTLTPTPPASGSPTVTPTPPASSSPLIVPGLTGRSAPSAPRGGGARRAGTAFGAGPRAGPGRESRRAPAGHPARSTADAGRLVM